MRYRANIAPGVTTINLDSINATTTGVSNHFELRNDGAGLTHNLAVNFSSGTLTTTTPGANLLHTRNSGYGENNITVAALLTGGGIRHQMNLPDNNSAGLVEVTAAGIVDSMRTGIWVRDQSIGPSTINVNGRVLSETSRAIHLSNNNVSDTTLTQVNIAAAGVVSSNNQGVYVGNRGGGPVQVVVAGSVQGGVEGYPDNVFSDYSAGVVMDASAGDATLVIQSSGSVSSINDLAVVDNRFSAGSAGGVTFIENAGEITGYLLLGENDTAQANSDILNNTGSLLLRDFSDDDHNGVRETENTALIDFGDGIDSFSNSGDLILAHVISATTPGIEAGELVNLERFDAGGVISLCDTDGGGSVAVAGDTLFISGTTTTDSARLCLDVQLGDENSPADVLTLEDVTTGTGPILLDITNASGTGALTSGNGILVVRISGSSPADAFGMVPVTVNGFVYNLVQADGQNWYLQNHQQMPAYQNSNAESIPVLPLPIYMLLVILLAMVGVRRLQI
ncbi:MAG: hypothetical protein ACK5ME_10055 [Parahaliea sp.]